MPITGVTFIVGAASLAGIPPARRILEQRRGTRSGHGRAGSPVPGRCSHRSLFLSALYMSRLVFVVFFGKQGRPSAGVHESPTTMTAPLALLAIGSVLAGALAIDWPGPYDGFGAFLLADREFLHQEAGGHFILWLSAVSVVLAGSGAVLGMACLPAREHLTRDVGQEACSSAPNRSRQILRGRCISMGHRQDRAVRRRGVLALRSGGDKRPRSRRPRASRAIVCLSGTVHPIGTRLQLRPRHGDRHLGAGGRMVDRSNLGQTQRSSDGTKLHPR